jgi:putative transposase
VVKPGDRKNIIAYLATAHQVSITRACKTIHFPKSMFYYRSVKDDTAVIIKLKELAEQKPREGQDKFYDRIRAEGLIWNYKRVRRVYLMLGLNQRRRIRRRVPARVKQPLVQPQAINSVWSMDFMSDSLQTKRKFRTLNIMDDFNRKAISVEADFSFPSQSVVEALKRAIHENGKPDKIRVDNGPEFISSTLADWCKEQNIHLQYIQPGKPMQNGFIERFNRTFRQDVLDAYLFEDIMQVRLLAEEWMNDYNNKRPHESLGGITPNEFYERTKQLSLKCN